jgi:hypothetical protein
MTTNLFESSLRAFYFSCLMQYIFEKTLDSEEKHIMMQYIYIYKMFNFQERKIKKKVNALPSAE